MVTHQKGFLNVAAPRPVHDRMEVRLDNEPDTPMHHSYRGNTTAAGKYNLIRWTRILTVFLLIVVTVTWLFVDLEDLNIRSGWQRGRSHVRLMNELLEQRHSEDESRSVVSLLAEEDLYMLEYRKENSKQAVVRPSAKERWMHLLDPIPVQPLINFPHPVDRSIPVVILLPQCCEMEALPEDDAEACHGHVMTRCSSLSDSKCYQDAVLDPICGSYEPGQPNSELTYFAALMRLKKLLIELGWANLEVKYSPCSQQKFGAESLLAEWEQMDVKRFLDKAKLIIADAQDLEGLLPSHPKALFVAIDSSASGSIPSNLLQLVEHERVLSIWRRQSLSVTQAEDGSLVQGRGSNASSGSGNDQAVSATTLAKVYPLLSQAFRIRYPLDCGGDVEHLRFAEIQSFTGAFAQNFSHWSPPRMAERPIDVAFIIRSFPGKPMPEPAQGSSWLANHFAQLTARLKVYGSTSGHSIQFNATPSESYSEYLKRLQQVKIVVVPAGAADAGELDFEAALCGCLLLKVEPESYVTYPDVFRPDDHILGVPFNWTGLSQQLDTALQDIEHSQRMADRTYHYILEMSDMRRYAADIDAQMVAIRTTLARLGS